MRRAWFLLVLFSQAILGGQPNVRIFTTEDGLVRNWIQRIRSDSRGNLWFCTVEGISLFDGSRFTNFTVRDGLPNRLVNDMLESSSGEYWIATNGGLSRFHPVTAPGHSRFENFTLGTDSRPNRIQPHSSALRRLGTCSLARHGQRPLSRAPHGRTPGV